MIVQKDRLIEVLKLKKVGGKGWYTGTCPYCGKKDKFGVIFGEISSFNCFSGNCREHGPISSLLRHIGRLDLMYKESLKFEKLENKLKMNEEKKVDITTPIKPLPIGFRHVTYHTYLDMRGFTDTQYERYSVGVSSLVGQSYVIFPVKHIDGQFHGWVARSTKSKSEIKQLNEKRELAGEPVYLRYRNSDSTDFSKLVYGIHEIVPGVTKTMVIVEGIFDKSNLDRKMCIDGEDEFKIGCTFGKKISLEQTILLQEQGIENLILLWDSNDAVNELREHGCTLAKYFNVKVGWTPSDRDPGDFTETDIIQVFENLKDPYDFHNSMIQKRILT